MAVRIQVAEGLELVNPGLDGRTGTMTTFARSADRRRRFASVHGADEALKDFVAHRKREEGVEAA